MPDYPSVVLLSTLDGQNGFRLNGAAAGDSSGRSVSGLGDVNGDGIDDFIVGSHAFDANGDRDAGAAYVVFGDVTGRPASIDLDELNGGVGFRLEGVAFDDRAGFWVSGGGDMNGDGIDEIVVAAVGTDIDGFRAAGSVYVIFGTAAGFDPIVDLASIDGVNGFRLDGTTTGELAGRGCAAAGDVNNDGYGDLIVGGYGADPEGYTQGGSSYVLFGKAGGFAPFMSLTALDGSNGFRLDGAAPGDASGFSVSSAGDFNGDGYDDVLVGAEGVDFNGIENAGATYVFFGKAGGFPDHFEFEDLDGTIAVEIGGASENELSGDIVAPAGDVNGDGLDDIVIGARGADPGGDVTAGSTYVVFGRSSGIGGEIDLAQLDGGDGFRLDGVGVLDFSGRCVAGAGDVNGDGFADVVVGAPYADPNGLKNAGAAYVIFGKASGFAAVIDLGSLDGTGGFRLDGGDIGGKIGRSVASAGDVNDDGYADLLLGGYGTDIGAGIDVGASFIYYGLRPTDAVVRIGTEGGQSLAGGRGDDKLAGRGGDDRLRGHEGGDKLAGNNGDDLLRGNAGDDTLWGGTGDDILDGGTGADGMEGDKGDDTYIANDAGDAAVEAANEGNDTVKSRKSHTLENNVENLALYGVDEADATGNGLANRLLGNAAANTLSGLGGGDWIDGKGGGDTMRGGSGDDSYAIDESGDRAIEAAGEGVDTIYASISRSLAAVPEIENLILTGAANLNATGSAFANELKGNNGDNIIDGGDGRDTIGGGMGRDILIGGAAGDVFLWQALAESRGASADIVDDFVRGQDKLDLGGIDANALADGRQDFRLDAGGAFSAGELRLTVQGSNLLVEGNTDADAAAEFAILLRGVAVLTAADFV